jgi:hypothetical protein
VPRELEFGERLHVHLVWPVGHLQHPRLRETMRVTSLTTTRIDGNKH